MSDIGKFELKRFDVMKLDSFGFGIDFSRDDFWEYRWWECELHLTFGRYYFTIRIKRYV